MSAINGQKDVEKLKATLFNLAILVPAAAKKCLLRYSHPVRAINISNS